MVVAEVRLALPSLIVMKKPRARLRTTCLLVMMAVVQPLGLGCPEN